MTTERVRARVKKDEEEEEGNNAEEFSYQRHVATLVSFNNINKIAATT
jgi:hypothetical protein